MNMLWLREPGIESDDHRSDDNRPWFGRIFDSPISFEVYFWKKEIESHGNWINKDSR